MDWDLARRRIEANVKAGTDLNTPHSTHRFVESVSERGFRVSIGRRNKVWIPWSMLRDCFSQLPTADGLRGAFFKRRFPREAERLPSYVHLVGQVFVAAGIARAEAGLRKRTWIYKKRG